MNGVVVKRTVASLALFITITTLSACDLLSPPAEKIGFLENQFTVLKPASWSLRTDLNDEADIQMANLFKEAYMVILSENKQDFDNIALEEHSDLTRSLMQEVLENYSESKREYIGGKKYKIIRHVVNGKVEDLDLTYWHVSIETKNHFHQMLFWSLASTFKKNAATYDSVIQSFEETN